VASFIEFAKQRLALASPLTIFLILATGVVLLYAQPASRLARRFFVAALVLFWLITTPVGAGFLAAGLSHGLTQIHTAEEAGGADAVVVLSAGAITLSAGGHVVGILTRPAMLRVLEAARVSKVINARLVVASGGNPRPDLLLLPESRMLRDALIDAGVPPDRIVEESVSRTTREQAEQVPAVLRAHGIRRFVLVTSSVHMRRAIALFRSAGLDPVPSISLMRSEHQKPPPLLLPSQEALDISNAAVYDYAAWVYYWWNGWLRAAHAG
jgi:uncharacterized SAM-binding protein YcdF (DUF218 family)